jgi:hypothetical protein
VTPDHDFSGTVTIRSSICRVHHVPRPQCELNDLVELVKELHGTVTEECKRDECGTYRVLRDLGEA